MADELSKIVTEGIMRRILKRKPVDEKIQDAHEKGGDYVKTSIENAFKSIDSSTLSSAMGVDTTKLLSPEQSAEINKFILDSENFKGIPKPEKTVEEIITTSDNKGLFGNFIDNLKTLFSGEGSFLKNLSKIFRDGALDFAGIFQSLVGNLFGGKASEGMFSGVGGFIASLFGGASGGIMTPRGKMSGYSTGGIARGSQSGYPAILHGTEAVVPLPNGKAIPVDMKGGSTQNNIVVNVTTDGRVSTQESTGPDMDQMGTAIAKAVQIELQNQKRSGGMLSPYGPA